MEGLPPLVNPIEPTMVSEVLETAVALVVVGLVVMVVAADAGAAKSVSPPRIKAALSAPFIHT